MWSDGTLNERNILRNRGPPSWVAVQGHEEVVRVSPERDDVEIGSKDKEGQTSPSLAEDNNRKSAVEPSKPQISRAPKTGRKG